MAVFSASESTIDFAWANPGPGDYELVTLTTDDDGAAAQSDTVHVTIEDVTATGHFAMNGPCTVFPNPAIDHAYVHCNFNADPSGRISVSNLQGIVFPVSLEGFGNDLHADLSSLTPGIYLVWYTSSQGVFVGKVIVQ
jgi:hypothetical protein